MLSGRLLFERKRPGPTAWILAPNFERLIVSDGRDKKRKCLFGVPSSASGVVRIQKTVQVPDLVG